MLDPIQSKAEFYSLLAKIANNDENAEILMFELRQRLAATDTSTWPDPTGQG